jgi:hypothetical protein
MNESAAEPAAKLGNDNNALAQFTRELIGLRRITVTVLA